MAWGKNGPVSHSRYTQYLTSTPLPHSHEDPHSRLQRLEVLGYLSRACYTPSCISRWFQHGLWAWSVETREAKALSLLGDLQPSFCRLPKSCSTVPSLCQALPTGQGRTVRILVLWGRVRQGVGRLRDLSKQPLCPSFYMFTSPSPSFGFYRGFNTYSRLINSLTDGD